VELHSTSFDDDMPIPARYTCDGEGLSPELHWRGVPRGTGALACRCVDPDAPSGVFTHWLIWNLDPSTGALDEGKVPTGAREGTNSFGGIGYDGPCPPRGHGAHHYHFELLALRQPLDLEPGATAEQFAAAIRDARIESVELIGRYERS